MEAIGDISSTCEHDSVSRNETSASGIDCESDAEYDSENETIDVICENNSGVPYIERNSDLNPYNILNRGLYESKTFNYQKNYSNSNNNESLSSVMNSKSKTFLIDNILGNNKICNSQEPESVRKDEGDNFEEAADEHNGELHFKL
jgi:hypothetical protein